MEWIEGKISRSSFVDFNVTLYRINDDIYDEIIFKNKEYYLIRRCGVETYRFNHGREVFVTNNKILVYPLEDHEIFEQKLELDALKTFNELTAISIINGEYISTKFTLDVDKRYIEYIDMYDGNNLALDMSKYDEGRTSYIYKIKNMLPHELIDNDLFVDDYASSPNIIVNGYSKQEVVYDENDNLLSPTFNSPSEVLVLGRQRNDFYEVSICNRGTDDVKKDLWHCVQYPTCGYTLDSIKNKTPVVEFDYLDSKLSVSGNFASGIAGALMDNFTLHASCYVYSIADKVLNTTFSTDDGGSLYLNDNLIVSSGALQNSNVTMIFKAGWNKIDVVFQEGSSNDGFKFGVTLSTQNFVSYFLSDKYGSVGVTQFKYKVPIQLSSVGDEVNSVSDYIYRDTDMIWKIKHNINKYTFTGDESWKITSVDKNTNKFIFTSDLFSPITTVNTINVLSNCLLGVNDATNLYEISIIGNELCCILPSTDFPNVESINNFSKNNSWYILYVMPETITYEVLNQSDCHNFSKYINLNTSLEVVNELTQEIDINYSTSITCNYYKIPISVIPQKTYKLTRPIVGDVCYLEYYDKDKNIIGYSEYFDTEALSFEFTIPENVHYISILDGTCTSERTYSLMEVNGSNIENTSISQLQLTVNGETTILPLPHELNPGDELEFDIDRNRWTYYPLSIDEDFIYYDGGLFESILLDKTDVNISCQNGLYLTAAISCIDVRELTYPVNVQVTDEIYTGNNGYGYITWDELAGASEYAIYVDGNLIASMDALGSAVQEYHCTSEQQGDVTIIGYNNFATSEHSDTVPICTVPNSPVLEYVDTVYENNRYYVTIKFTANSSIADLYEVIYSIDGSNDITVNFDHDKTYGKEILYTFNAPAINNNFIVQLTATNLTGRNNYIAPITLVTNDGFSVWTYKTAMQEMLLGWIDEFTDEFSYSLKYSINQEDWKTLMVDGKTGSGDRLLEYIPLNPDDEMRVCIAVVKNGYVNIYTKPITVSKALDKTLIPPANFTGTKVDSGQIQFTWDDNYNVDADFELYYQYSDGSSQTIFIPKESSTTGDYTYVHNVDTYGFITARLRMVWELGESEYTDNIIVYNIPIVSEAPALLPRKRENNKLKISWETYEFIEKYILYFTVDGVQTIIEQVDSEYFWDIPYEKESISINAAVKALFIDGTYTNISESLSFNICNNDNLVHSLIYTHHEFDEQLYTTVGSRGLETPYPINTLSMNSYAHLYDLIEKTYSSYLFTEYDLIENYWGHNVGGSYPLWTTQKSSYKFNYPLLETTYSTVSTDNTVETVIYVPATTEYPLYSEFVKIAIATLGDSITAG